MTVTPPKGFTPTYLPIVNPADGSWYPDTTAGPIWWHGPEIDVPGVYLMATWTPADGIEITDGDGASVPVKDLPYLATLILGMANKLDQS